MKTKTFPPTRFRSAAGRATLIAALFLTSGATAAPTLFNFTLPADRFTAASGTGTLEYFDPDLTEWGPGAVAFGPASDFGLPALPGGDPQVMSFPAFTNRQGLLLKHGTPANGAYEGSSLVSSYTIIYDVYFPAASDGKWRSLFQTDAFNSPKNDGEFFVVDAVGGGIGIDGNYQGRVTADTWHRLAFSVRASPDEGQVQRYVDGQFVGAIGTTGSIIEERFSLGPEVLLLTDDNDETAAGYLSSFYYVDRAMSGAEITALGGPHADGAATPGAPAPAYTEKMVRRPAAIGHRGGDYGSAPDNTLPALRQAFLKGAAGVEVDTRLTADGVAVCFHDSTVDRTTNGSGPVDSLPLSELKLLDAGSKFGPEWAGEKVPTLEEALAEAKGKGIVYLDIKTGGQAQAFADAVNATGFPLADLWFWTPGDFGYAQEIRTLLPEAKILWGDPDPGWSTDPTYFSTLRDAGVFGFSIGTGTGTPDIAFAARAKKEGFIVEVYTINDLDSMRRCAAAGVDYMETDFPATLVALQPVAAAKATFPGPEEAGVIGSPTTVLRWFAGTGATSHLVHFGTANPPPLVSTQTSDLYQTPLLAAGATYYWRIDEVTPGGTVTGDVWSFTTPAPTSGTKLEWEFSGTLAPSLGNGSLTYADGAITGDQCFFETSDDNSVPHMDGQPTDYLRVAALSDNASGLAVGLTGIAPNGGSATRINRYTLVFDLLIPNPGTFTSFFNVNTANGVEGDGDFFLNGIRALGVSEIGYSTGSAFQPGIWQRLAISADLPAGIVATYVDGVLKRTRTGAALTDGRFALLPGTEPSSLRLFSDEDGETSEILISSFAFTNVPLTSIQVVELGAPQADGIFFTAPGTLPPLTIQRSGNSVIITWPAAVNRRLQRSTSLSGWTDIPGTAGFGTWTETIVPGDRVFFRAIE